MTATAAGTALVMTVGLASPALGQSSAWVEQGVTGLVYQRDNRGDRIMNFSEAGYQGGAPIPTAASVTDRVLRVSATPGDNRSSIQAAIDQVSAWSVNEHGYRGVVELQAGQYDISDGLVIHTSGVILRGAGDGAAAASNTVLRSTSTDQINLIDVRNTQQYANNLFGQGTPVNIVEKVVPAGASSFRVADTSSFGVGDWVNVKHTPQQAWFDAVSGRSANDPSGENWGWNLSNPKFTTQHERKITRIEGDRVFVDAPLSHSIDSRLASGTIQHYTDRRIDHVGIENIRGTSIYDASETDVVDGRTVFVDEDHASTFISLTHAENAWVRNITAEHMKDSAVRVGGVSRSITVHDAKYVEPVSVVTGGRRYAFNMNGGSRVLMTDLEADSARRAFINNSTFNGFNRGPNVFLDAEATNSFVRSGPHQNYSTGALYDNVTDDLGFEARWSSSTSVHGWRGANTVLWNAESPIFQIQSPPFARNYGIGITGLGGGGTSIQTNPAYAGSFDSIGTKIDFNDPDNPLNSLYIAQRLEIARNPNVEQREYWVGDFDGMEADGPDGHDDVYVDSDWLAEIDTFDDWKGDLEITGFDDGSANRRVPFSFRYELDPDERVLSAVLTLATKRLGSHSDNDPIYIDSLDALLRPTIRENWGMEFESGIQVMDIELYGDLGYLQDGLLNILVVDDRPVDWAVLTLNVGTVPEPGVAGLVVAAGLGWVGRRRRGVPSAWKHFYHPSKGCPSC
ncbi:MAG: hypothetical protein AAGK09_05430 [Planctomycetota bacterium]